MNQAITIITEASNGRTNPLTSDRVSLTTDGQLYFVSRWMGIQDNQFFSYKTLASAQKRFDRIKACLVY